MEPPTKGPSIANATELREKAHAITKRRTLYAAGAGLIPFPILDVATLLIVQTNMIRDISKVYKQENYYQKNKIKSFISTLVGDLGTAGVVSGMKAIPVVGSIIGVASAPITGAAATYALGKVFTNHFDQGGNLLDFDPASSREYFYEEFKSGRKLVASQKVVSSTPSTETSAIVDPTTAKQTLLKEYKEMMIAMAALEKKIADHVTVREAAAAEDMAMHMEINLTSAAATVPAEKTKTTKYNKGLKKANDLTIIEGIGPGINKVLNNAGIYTYENLSNKKASELETILKDAGGKFNFADPGTWPEQASLAAAGKMEELEVLKDKLMGGKRKKATKKTTKRKTKK